MRGLIIRIKNIIIAKKADQTSSLLLKEVAVDGCGVVCIAMFWFPIKKRMLVHMPYKMKVK